MKHQIYLPKTAKPQPKETAAVQVNDQPANSGPLHRLFARQQPKLHCTKQTTALLKTFAEGNYQNIALLLKKWLTEEPVSASKKVTKQPQKTPQTP